MVFHPNFFTTTVLYSPAKFKTDCSTNVHTTFCSFFVIREQNVISCIYTTLFLSHKHKENLSCRDNIKSAKKALFQGLFNSIFAFSIAPPLNTLRPASSSADLYSRTFQVVPRQSAQQPRRFLHNLSSPPPPWHAKTKSPYYILPGS